MLHYKNRVQQLLLLHPIQILVVFLFCSIVISFAFSVVYDYFGIDAKKDVQDVFQNKLLSKFYLSVILAPIVETFILTIIPFYVLKKLSVTNSYFIVFLLSFIFAIAHTYSIYYIVFAFISGLFFNLFFMIIENKTNLKTAFIYTAIFHSLYNLFAFIMNTI